MDSFAIPPSCPIAGSLCCFPSPLKLHLSWKFIYWHSSLLLVGYLYLLEIPPLRGLQQNTPLEIKLRCWLVSPMRTITQFSSVTQWCPTLCDPMNRSTPGLPVHHQLPEFTQTHVHRVSDAIQPSHPLSSPSPPAPNPFQHQGLLQ